MTLTYRPTRNANTGTAYLYWRVLVTAKQAVGFMAFAEVSMRENAGGVSIAVGGTPSASENYATNPIYPPRAFDGDIATYWSDNKGNPPIWLQYKFIKKVVLTEIAITYGPSGWVGIPAKIEFHASNDGINFKEQWRVDNVGAWAFGATKVFAKP